jgi:hypothetical protein
LEFIGPGAFEDCIATGSLTFGNGPLTLSDYAFNCYLGGFSGGLTLGSNIVSIADNALSGMSNITTLTFKGFDNDPS